LQNGKWRRVLNSIVLIHLLFCRVFVIFLSQKSLPKAAVEKISALQWMSLKSNLIYASKLILTSFLCRTSVISLDSDDEPRAVSNKTKVISHEIITSVLFTLLFSQIQVHQQKQQEREKLRS